MRRLYVLPSLTANSVWESFRKYECCSGNCNVALYSLHNIQKKEGGPDRQFTSKVNGSGHDYKVSRLLSHSVY